MQSFILKKKTKTGTKIALFEHIIYEISTLKFIKNGFLTVIASFGIGSTFSKGSEKVDTVSEGLGPGLLYKICRNEAWNSFMQHCVP